MGLFHDTSTDVGIIKSITDIHGRKEPGFWLGAKCQDGAGGTPYSVLDLVPRIAIKTADNGVSEARFSATPLGSAANLTTKVSEITLNNEKTQMTLKLKTGGKTCTFDTDVHIANWFGTLLWAPDYKKITSKP